MFIFLSFLFYKKTKSHSEKIGQIPFKYLLFTFNFLTFQLFNFSTFQLKKNGNRQDCFDLWSNRMWKKDICNVKNRITRFESNVYPHCGLFRKGKSTK
jgi:hypothetical protein